MAPASTAIYTLSLHDALPIFVLGCTELSVAYDQHGYRGDARQDRKSTRLNSSHVASSYAVFCLKKKKSRPGMKSCADANTATRAKRKIPTPNSLRTTE